MYYERFYGVLIFGNHQLHVMIQAGQLRNTVLLAGRAKIFVFSPKCSNQIWGTPNLLLNRYMELLPHR
jgi:hypothetical protein